MNNAAQNSAKDAPLDPKSASASALAHDVPPSTDDANPQIIEGAIALARRWTRESVAYPPDRAAQLLAGVLKDPGGLGFTTQFVDGVIRPEDTSVAAKTLARIAPDVPKFVPGYLKSGVKLGAVAGPAAPGVVVPVARKILRQLVGHLVIDATPAALGRAIKKLRDDNTKLNLNLLGEAVLGEKEAAARMAGTRALLARDDVDYVSIKVSACVAPHAAWGFDAAVEEVCDHLTPLFADAARMRGATGQTKFVNLDMEEYGDLDMTIAVFTKLLDRPEFKNLEAGIVIQAYLPDALGAYKRLADWARVRVANGGARIKVRLVKGANLPMEQVEAELHGWPLATWGSKQDTDTNYLRVLDWALRPENTQAVRIGVAGHNLFDIAHTWLLAGHRGVRNDVEFEMLLGMAKGQVEAVKNEVGAVRLYTPVVAPSEFDVAIAYLVRRLEEGASSENFMSAVFELDSNPDLFDREEQRYLQSVAALDDATPPPHRVPQRYAAVPHPGPGNFQNTPDTDPSIPEYRQKIREVLVKAPTSTAGDKTIADSQLADADAVDKMVKAVAKAGAKWGAMPAAERSAILHRAGDELEARRYELLEAMAHEAGKTIDQGDTEVSEGIDFAHFYAELAVELEKVPGAIAKPRNVTVVVPPWNFPMAIPAGGVLAALAAGSGVVFKPASLTRHTAAVVAEALWAAGVPKDVLRFAPVPGGGLGQTLVEHPLVDQVILTGSYETAEMMRSYRPGLRLMGETSGKNAIIVTPSADLNLAVKDVAYSAFSHAGQKCSAASLVILVGSMARSRRFRDQLVDAVKSMKVGPAWDGSSRMGPLISEPGPKLRDGLTKLEPGQNWVVRPRQLDDSGAMWSPGIRAGVEPGSEYHMTEYFGPILGVMRAESLEQAVEWANAVDYGLTSGLHSLDREEIEYWLEHIHAGNVYVNRVITGAIVRRQPFGGWKKSAVGAGAKAGGPNYLIGLTDWQKADTAIPGLSATTQVPNSKVNSLFEGAKPQVDAADVAFWQESAASDAFELATRFANSDISGLKSEHNVLRYRPTLAPVRVRLAEGGSFAELVRVIAAGLASPSAFEVSMPADQLEKLRPALGGCRVCVLTGESDAEFADRLKHGAPDARVRLIGGNGQKLLEAIGGRPDVAVWDQPVTASGRLELLPFLHEQAVSITAHRFGTPDPMTDGLV